MRRLGDPEQGSGGTSLSWTLLWPAVLLLVIGGIQFGVHSYAQNLALGAAQVGAREAATYPPSAERGQHAATAFLTRSGSATVRDATVTVTLDGDRVTVTVTGTSQNLLPGVTFTLSELAAAPVEQR